MTVELISDTDLRRRAIQILVRELGPGDSARFLNILNPPEPGADSVERRRKWLESIDQEVLAAKILEKMKRDYEAVQRGETPSMFDDTDSNR